MHNETRDLHEILSIARLCASELTTECTRSELRVLAIAPEKKSLEAFCTLIHIYRVSRNRCVTSGHGPATHRSVRAKPRYHTRGVFRTHLGATAGSVGRRAVTAARRTVVGRVSAEARRPLRAEEGSPPPPRAFNPKNAEAGSSVARRGRHWRARARAVVSSAVQSTQRVAAAESRSRRDAYKRMVWHGLDRDV